MLRYQIEELVKSQLRSNDLTEITLANGSKFFGYFETEIIHIKSQLKNKWHFKVLHLNGSRKTIDGDKITKITFYKSYFPIE